MVPSPKVATYDLQPEMNAKGVADEVALNSNKIFDCGFLKVYLYVCDVL